MSDFLPRACLFRILHQSRPTTKYSDWKAGSLHAWSIDNGSDEITFPIPVGIVEDSKTGEIQPIRVENIRFQVPGF